MNKNFNKFSYNVDDNGNVIKNCEPHHLNALDETPFNVFIGPCLLSYVNGWNDDSSDISFVKFYDSVSAPIVGTDTPFFSLGINAKSSNNFNFSSCISITKGLWLVAVAGVSDSNVTPPSTAINIDLGIVY